MSLRRTDWQIPIKEEEEEKRIRSVNRTTFI